MRDKIQFMILLFSVLMAFNVLDGRWVLNLELFGCNLYFVDDVSVWCEREGGGAGYKTVPESLIRAIKPELLLAKVHQPYNNIAQEKKCKGRTRY